MMKHIVILGKELRELMCFLFGLDKQLKNQGKLSLMWNCENGFIPWAWDCVESSKKITRSWTELWNFVFQQ